MSVYYYVSVSRLCRTLSGVLFLINLVFGNRGILPSAVLRCDVFGSGDWIESMNRDTEIWEDCLLTRPSRNLVFLGRHGDNGFL